MTGPAVQSGSAFGGFIEGVTGGFQDITELKRRRRLEQQVAEQLRVQAERQGLVDERQTTLFEQSQEDRERAQQLEDFQLLQEHGIVRTSGGVPTGSAPGVPESVSNLRSGVADNLLDPQARGLSMARAPGQLVPAPGQTADSRLVGQTLTGQGVPQVDPDDAGLAQFGLRRVGPSRTDLINDALSAPNPREFLRKNPRALGALDDTGLLQTVIDKFTPITVNFQGVQRSFANNDEAVSFRNMLALESSRDPITPAALRTEFNRDRVVTDSALIASSFERLKRVAQADPTGPNDIALVFSFMKMVDPGSTVREGEFATARNAAGIPTRIVAMYNQALEGTLLGDVTRLEFLDAADKLIAGQRDVLERVMDRYRGLAERSGIDPINVVFNPFAPIEEDVPPVGNGVDEPGNPFVPGR